MTEIFALMVCYATVANGVVIRDLGCAPVGSYTFYSTKQQCEDAKVLHRDGVFTDKDMIARQSCWKKTVPTWERVDK